MAKRILALMAILVITGCTDADYRREVGSLGKRHKITMYSGGKAVGEWTSTGKPRSAAAEDGWAFVDETTKHLITVTGDCVIETLDN